MRETISHDLDHATAQRAVERAFEHYRQQYRRHDPQGRWLDDQRFEASFRAAGMHLQGVLTLRPGEVELAMEVPRLLRAFQRKAIQVVEREVRAWIERARRGELD